MARDATVVSDYEAQRQANIAKNQALLRELQLNAASVGIAPKGSKGRTSSGTPRSKPKPKPRVKQEDVQPRRTSSRLLGIVADSEVAKRKAEEEREAIELQNRAKRQRVTDELKLGDIVTIGKSWDQSGNWLRNVGPAQPYERTFDVEKVVKTGNKELKELREKLSRLELWEDYEPNRLKVTPERIYAMGFHPTEDKALVFAGDKLGNLGLFDGSQKIVKREEDDDEEELDGETSPAITTFKTHTRTISAMHFSASHHKAVYTASYDSSIRMLDLEKGLSTEIYAPSQDDIDEPLSGVSIPVSEPNMLYFTSLNGLFGIHDMRTPYKGTTSTQLFTLSEKKIGGFSTHPLHPHFVATASLDRTLKVWDIRKVSGKGGSKQPALVAEHESKLSVSHAAFNAAGQVSFISLLRASNPADVLWRLPPPVTTTQSRFIISTNAALGRQAKLSQSKTSSL